MATQVASQYDVNGDPIAASSKYDVNGDPIKDPQAGSGDHWYNDQQNIGVLAGQFAKNAAAGVAKLPLQVVGKLGALIGKLSDKTGNTQGMERQQLDQLAGRESKIDQAMGTEPGLGQMTGNMAATFGLPVGGAIEGGAELASPLLKMLGAGRAAKPLAEIATSGAANAGLGAVQGEGEQGGAQQGALMGLLAGGGTSAAAKGAGALAELVAPKMLEFGAGATKAMQKGVNPPTTAGFKEVLQNDLVPVFGGYKAAADKIGDFLSKDNATRAGLMDASGTKVNITGAIATAKKSLADDIANGGIGGLTPHDEAAAQKWFDDYAEQAKQNPQYNNGWLPASEAMKLKTSAAKNSKFIAGETPEGRPLASEKYSGAVRSQIENLMAGKSNAEDFTAVNDRMARMAPIENAIDNRSHANGISPWEVASLGGAGIAMPFEVMAGHPMAAAATSLYPLWELIKHDPGAAAAVFKAGKLLNTHGNRLIPIEELMKQFSQPQGGQ